MTTMTSIERLAAALNAHSKAKVAREPGDNPYHEHDLDQMRSAGLMSAQDKTPALNMAAKAPDSPMAYEMERSRFEVEAAAKTDSSAKRMAAARARAARKAQFDEIMTSPVKPDEKRMAEAWAIMSHLFPTVVRIAEGKRRWAARHLGDVTDDVGAIVLENMALMLAKSDKDLDLMLKAAEQIGSKAKRTGKVEGHIETDDEAKARRREAKARKWLMQVVNNRVMDTLVDVYFRSHNLRWENIDIVATVMATVNGVGDDPLLNRHKADRAPSFLGTRFQRPGGVDSALLATAINAAIGDRGLDRLVELLLNHTRTDGRFQWKRYAEDVFLASPDGGEWMWQAVVQATTGRTPQGKEWTMDRARKARGDAARTYVRQQFEWLPSFIVSVLDAFDPAFIGFAAHAQGGGRAILASEFELYYLGDEPERRLLLSPVLKYGSAEEAAAALLEHLAQPSTTDEWVRV